MQPMGDVNESAMHIVCLKEDTSRRHPGTLATLPEPHEVPRNASALRASAGSMISTASSGSGAGAASSAALAGACGLADAPLASTLTATSAASSALADLHAPSLRLSACPALAAHA
jgi:hypothetical protein